jgi:SAM-dependent methyltransferase
MNASIRNDRTRLVLLSFLMLFVELALIRWAGSNVLYLSFFSNFVLLGSFLGIGLGFLRANAPRDLSGFAPTALGALVAVVYVFPVDVHTEGGDLIFFSGGTTTGPPRELVLPVIFLAVAFTMMLIGEGVARAFARFEALEAYRLDLVGSLAGIAGITALSFLRLPPIFWGSIAAITMLALAAPRIRWFQILGLLALVSTLGIESFASNASWSPYYKITTRVSENGELGIDVNGVPHQSHAHSTENPLYTLVYGQIPDNPLADVLIIGAGGGNDVSVALARGAGRVDAVEIDPRLYDLGKSRHPDDPYQDPRVDIHINDGRAFVERTQRKYDLILLALPDSITLVSGQSSLRLESYLFTKEAVDAYRDILKPNGAFAMYNYYREDWLADRFSATLANVFEHAPCRGQVFNFGGARADVLVVGSETSAVPCGAAGAELWAAPAGTAKPATDDHPFPYLHHNRLPAFYVVSLGLILLASLVLVRVGSGPFKQMLPFADLFCMGVAFLLLETKYVVQFALLFGTTWVVNAFVFAGVLLSVLVAVALSKRVTIRQPALLYGLLLAAIVVAFVVPLDALLNLAFAPRLLVATMLAFFPIFTANLVFSERFKATGDSTTAFGANLLGAMFGGVLEYAALITGYRLLLVIVAVFYGLAFLLGRRHLRTA